jgi:proteasome lid subunit RPN8/RPN11
MMLFLPGNLAREIEAHAREELPNEAVGLIAGQHGKAVAVLRLVNLTQGRTFFVDPYSQYQALRAIASAGLSTVAIYHSHPAGCLCLSDLDCMWRYQPAPLQVVVSLTETDLHVTQMRAYGFADGRPVEVPIERAE